VILWHLAEMHPYFVHHFELLIMVELHKKPVAEAEDVIGSALQIASDELL